MQRCIMCRPTRCSVPTSISWNYPLECLCWKLPIPPTPRVRLLAYLTYRPSRLPASCRLSTNCKLHPRLPFPTGTLLSLYYLYEKSDVKASNASCFMQRVVAIHCPPRWTYGFVLQNIFHPIIIHHNTI